MKTALIQEEPVVAVFCQNQILTNYFVSFLTSGGFASWVFSPSNPIPKEIKIYKCLVLFTGLETKAETEKLLLAASQLGVNTLVCLPTLPQLSEAVPELQALWQTWFSHTNELLTQSVSQLTTAQFILVDGWVDELGAEVISPLSLFLSGVSEGFYWQCRSPLSLLTTKQLAQVVLGNLGRPAVMPSILLQSESCDCFAISSQIVNLYETYFHTQVRPVATQVALELKPLFLVQAQQISSPQHSVVTSIAQHLQPPGKKSWVVVPPATSAPLSILTPSKSVEITQTTEVRNRVNLIANPQLVSQPTSQPTTKSSIQIANVDTPVEVTTSLSAPPVKPLILGDQLEKIFSQTRVKEKEKHLLKLQKTEKKAEKKLKHNKLLFILGSISSGVSLAILLLGVVFVTSTFLARKQLFATTPQSLVTFSESGEPPPSLGRTMSLLQPQLRLIGQFVDHPLVDESQSLVDAYQRLSTIQTLEKERQTLELAVAGHIMGQQTTSLEGVLEDFVRLTQTSYTNMAQLQSLFIPADLSEDTNKDWFSSLNNLISQKKNMAGYLQTLSPLLPSLLGLEDKPRIYAILFLNSSELRPTGGFVQAVALITVEKGQIIATQTLSSYEIDRRIGGVIEPPQDLEDILKEKSWYFRDSNWDPHHPESAKRAAWFIEKAMGVSVDGVVSMPTTAFAKLLDTTGPLTLPQYNESLTSKNIQERLNFHAEVELTEQLKNYPSAVLDVFFQHILKKSNQEFLAIVSTLPELFASGDLQISLLEETEQEIMQPLRWSGSLVLPICPSQFSQVPCMVDSVYQVETNVGVNRVNSSIKRKIEENIQLLPDSVKHQRKTQLSNTATTTAWPSGQYSTYVRWYMPLKNVLDEVVINGIRVDQNKLRISQEHGMQVVGVLTEVPIQTSVNIEFNYHQPIAQALPYSYFFFDQKQPGTELETYQVVVEQPVGSSVVRLAPNALIESPTLTFEPDKTGHRLTAVQFK